MSDERPPVISEDMLTGEFGSRVDVERGMSYAPFATITFILINVLVFVWELATSALSSPDGIVGAGALKRDLVLQGQFWRLGSATFLHGGPEHLIGNMLMLYVVGIACEHMLGKMSFTSVYVQAALAGSMLSAIANTGPSVGASGAVFGVMASVVTVLVVHRARVKLRDHRVAIVLAVLIAYQLVVGMVTPYVDNMAHLGGMLGGVLATLRMRPVFLSATSAAG